jgi:hypothetical protein
MLVQPPTVFRTEHILGRKIYFKIHTLAPHRIVHLRGVYQQDQLRFYTKETNAQLYTVIQFEYLEAQFLLNGIGPRCIDTLAPRITDY